MGWGWDGAEPHSEVYFYKSSIQPTDNTVQYVPVPAEQYRAQAVQAKSTEADNI
jgi:hypothetical protein